VRVCGNVLGLSYSVSLLRIGDDDSLFSPGGVLFIR
jgi:hypothetical protein